MKKYFKFAIILFLSGFLFFGASYFYLYSSLKSEQKAANIKEDNIPYAETPENRGLLFNLPGDKKVLIFLDFGQEISYIVNINNNNAILGDYAGYPIDYKFDLDYYVLSGIFDRLGGIDLEAQGELLRYTGVQVCDLINNGVSPDIPIKIVSSLCRKIYENGFSTDDFVFLIDNTNTALTVPECFYWQKYIKSLFSNSVFVNWEI